MSDEIVDVPRLSTPEDKRVLPVDAPRDQRPDESIEHTEADYQALQEICERYRQWWLDATQRAAKAEQDAANADKARRHAEIRASAWCVAAKNVARQHDAQGGAA